jgi:hypothetical protein
VSKVTGETLMPPLGIRVSTSPNVDTFAASTGYKSVHIAKSAHCSCQAHMLNKAGCSPWWIR